MREHFISSTMLEKGRRLLAIPEYAAIVSVAGTGLLFFFGLFIWVAGRNEVKYE